MSTETFIPTPLLFILDVAGKMKTLINEEGNLRLKLHVFVTGDSYSGFRCNSTFDESIANNDTMIEHDGMGSVVSPMSFQYLAGSKVDYQGDPEGSRLVIKNPNTAMTYGCGRSFSI